MNQFRGEEEKLINHDSFQAIASKFWGLLTKDEQGRVSKKDYVEVSLQLNNKFSSCTEYILSSSLSIKRMK